jgi:hypothetical protein
VEFLFKADREINLIVEPWGEEIPLPSEKGLVVKVEGQDAESMSVFWRPDAVIVWPPRYTLLTVLTRDGDEVMQFDTSDIPARPVPPRFQT